MFQCLICNYTTTRQFDFNRHLESKKHKSKNNKELKKVPKKYNCEHCNKSYSFHSGLSRHSKTHEVVTLTLMNPRKARTDDEIELMEHNNLLIEILRDNRELRKEILNQQRTNKIINNIKQVNNYNNNVVENHIENQQVNNVNNSVNNNVNNSVNNSVNTTVNNQVSINVFLNERCKNAVNLSDFIESIEIDDKTIEQCPNNGLIKNISDAFITALRQLDYYQRPIHCSDRKRSTLYIKDNDKWDKDIEHEHMKEAIDNISYKHFIQLKEWVSKHPNFEKDDKLQAEYIAMAKHITTDLAENNNKPYKKIIQNVGNETYVSGINPVQKTIES